MSFIELKQIDVSYDGKKKVLDNLNLNIEKGQLVSLLGPSGCGKTTTLRVIAGFITPNRGTFCLNEKNYTNIPTHKREFGIVFQSYALFPHMTVAENVAFGLKMRKISKSEIKKKVEDILRTVDLEEYGERFPKELSGGQRQRVALARALVIEPELLLLDEPLSNLDAKLRVKMRMEIRELQQKLKITTVFVTHDQEECFSISDKVAVMNGGLIEQYDSPETIYARPTTEFVARFVGFENFFDLEEKDGAFYVNNQKLNISNVASGKGTGRKGAIRPEDIMITNAGEYKENTLTGVALVRTYLGKSYQYKVETPLGNFIVNSPNTEVYGIGEAVTLYFPPDKLIVV